MKINTAALIYYSATGTTKKVLEAITKGLDIGKPKLLNLTSSAIRNADIPPIEEDLVIIGSPVYNSRIPTHLYPVLSSLKSNHKPVVLVSVYGNVEKGIALNELYAIAEKVGFKIIAAGSFIAEHSFSTDAVPIAKGRPTEAELKKAEEFGRNIKLKLSEIEPAEITSLKIPENKLSLIDRLIPVQVVRMLTKTPVVDPDLCSNCGVCAKLCPMSAIDQDTLEVNENKCLRCFSCVKRCNKKAREFVFKKKIITVPFFAAKNKLKNEPDLFL